MLRSLLRPVNRRLDRQLRGHVEDVTIPRLAELAAEVALVRATTVDVRRLLADELDANTEVAALVGRQLATLTEAVEALRGEVAELRDRLGQRAAS